MTEIVDVWMQHPTLRHSNHDMFESLRRWMGIETFDEVLPIELTLAAMHEAGVTAGLTAAWYGGERSPLTFVVMLVWAVPAALLALRVFRWV